MYTEPMLPCITEVMNLKNLNIGDNYVLKTSFNNMLT